MPHRIKRILLGLVPADAISPAEAFAIAFANRFPLATLSAKAGDASARLRVYVEEESAGMIVMGAFVHSRFRQAILGGVTSSLLHASPVPLFMAY